MRQMGVIMGFLSSLFGRSKKGDGDASQSRFVTERVCRDNLARQVSMTPQTMAQLRECGVSKAAMLRLEFFFYTDMDRKAEALAKALNAMGYQAGSDRSAGDNRLFLVNGWTVPLKMDDSVVLDWTRQMCKLGCEHDCEFDGWGTDPNQANGRDASGGQGN